MTFRLTANRVVLAVAFYAMVVFNVAYWRTVWQYGQAEGSRDWLLRWTMPLFMLALLNVLLQLLCWPKLHRVLLPLVLLAGSGVSYAVMVQGVYFNADMLANVFQTDQAEASAWLTWPFGLWLLGTGVVPAVLYVRFVRLRAAPHWYQALGWRLASGLASLLVVGCLALTAYGHYAAFFRSHAKIFHQVVPANLVSAGVKAAYNVWDANRPFEKIGTDAVRMAEPQRRKQLLVLVVGETTRAQNWGLNPGAPETTPELKAMSDVINFPNVSSCGTATAVSVPCMFSPMGREAYNGNRARHQENLLDILQRVGLYTSWRDNDGGCKGVCDRVRHINIRDLAAPEQCGDEGCLDATLLNGLAEEIRTMPGDGVIVLHTMGSHGPAYYQRYPDAFRVFQPTCDTAQIQNCSPQSLQNTYSNTVRYIDHVLAAAIRMLQAQPAVDSALWYVSDHGESLGEDGLYLHGAPYSVAPHTQTLVPMVFWVSSSWYQAQRLSHDCLRAQSNQSYSHDNWFHSILGLAGVQTMEYRKELDLFAGCRRVT